MGRKTDYTGKYYSHEIDPEEVKAKIHKEPLTTEEIAAYLSELGTYYHGNKNIHKRSIENHIKKICEESDGLLKKEEFLLNGVYVINPKFHGLLLTLLDTNYFDGRKNKRNLLNREELYSSLVKNIDIYLLDEDKVEIVNTPSYINAVLESQMTERLSREMAILLQELYHADPIFRFRMLKYVIESINKTRKWVSDTDNRVITGRLLYGAKAAMEENSVDGAIKKKKIQSDSLEDYIIQCLADKVNQQKREKDSDGEEIIRYPAVYLADLLYELNLQNNLEVERELKEIDDLLSSQEKFKRIEEKAKQILNEEDPFESAIFQGLMRLSKIYMVAPSVTAKEYELVHDFIEESMKKDKWDILYDFLGK